MYKTCPHCGSHLDPGETCDCKKEPDADNPKRIVTREDWVKARDFIKAAKRRSPAHSSSDLRKAQANCSRVRPL